MNEKSYEIFLNIMGYRKLNLINEKEKEKFEKNK